MEARNTKETLQNLSYRMHVQLYRISNNKNTAALKAGCKLPDRFSEANLAQKCLHTTRGSSAIVTMKQQMKHCCQARVLPL